MQPLLKPIHGDPRWHALMERLGRTPEQIAAIHVDLSLPAGASVAPPSAGSPPP